VTNGPCNLEIVGENFDPMLKSQNRVSFFVRFLLYEPFAAKRKGCYRIREFLIKPFANSLKSVQLYKLRIEIMCFCFELRVCGLAQMLYSS